MTTLTNTQYTGRKARTGSLCFDTKGRMLVFISYCDNCNGKVAMPMEEARYFSKRYRVENERLANRVLHKLIHRRTLQN